MWDKDQCVFPEKCADNEGRVWSSLALLLPLIILRPRAQIYGIHLILLTVASIWYWSSGSFASRVADGILVALLPFALLTWLADKSSTIIAYGVALLFYLVLGECHSLGELSNLPSWLAYLVVIFMLLTWPDMSYQVKLLLAAGVLFAIGSAILLIATAAGLSKLTWCADGFDNVTLGHLLTGIALFILVFAKNKQP